MARRYSRVSRPALQEVQQRVAELTAGAEEGVSGIRVIKAFAREDYVQERFVASARRVFDQSILTTRQRARYQPMIAFLPSIGIALFLFLGGREVIADRISLGEFTAFYTYLLILSGPVRMLGTSLSMAQRAVASGNRLFEILDRQVELSAPSGAPPLPAGGGRIQMRDVSLRYPAADPTDFALRNIDLEVSPGMTLALVG
ncbi:MAG: ABC transporter transmembrane domain-containing protein, partial [Phycisphaerales bacterium]